MLSLTGDSAYADEIERTLYTTFLAAPGLAPFWGARRLLLYGAHYIAPQHCFLKTHHCCVANLPRGLYQIAQIAVMQERDVGPVVQLFVPGTYDVKMASDGAEISVRLTIDVEPEAPATFGLRVRAPKWSTGHEAHINGRHERQVPRNGYLTFSRPWEKGDRLDLEIDMNGRVVPLPAPPGFAAQPFVAVERGPVVLARDIRLKTGESFIHDPVWLDAAEDGRIDLQRQEAPENIWLAFEAPVRPSGSRTQTAIPLCDYSSAGNTWDVGTSDFRVWMPVDRRDPRVGP